MFRIKVVWNDNNCENLDINVVKVTPQQAVIELEHFDMSKEYLSRQQIRSFRIWEALEFERGSDSKQEFSKVEQLV